MKRRLTPSEHIAIGKAEWWRGYHDGQRFLRDYVTPLSEGWFGVERTPAPGDTRVNAQTGRREVLCTENGGHNPTWLEVPTRVI